MSKYREVTLTVGDLRIMHSMMQTMYDVLHADQPSCGEHGAMELVLHVGGQERNITKHVPVLLNWLDERLSEVEAEVRPDIVHVPGTKLPYIIHTQLSDDGMWTAFIPELGCSGGSRDRDEAIHECRLAALEQAKS